MFYYLVPAQRAPLGAVLGPVCRSIQYVDRNDYLLEYLGGHPFRHFSPGRAKLWVRTPDPAPRLGHLATRHCRSLEPLHVLSELGCVLINLC